MNAAEQVCPSCGTSASAGASFCRGCGAALAGSQSAPQTTATLPEPARRPDGGGVAVSQYEAARDFVPQAPLGLLDRASSGDRDALATMFRQFLSDREEVLALEYLGLRGLWIFGVRSFACVTDRRFATIQAKRFGHIEYHDTTLDSVNSSAIVVPSKLALYVFVVLSALMTLGLALLLLPWTLRLFYRFRKCGLVVWVRGHGMGGRGTAGSFTFTPGLQIYVFTDRKLLGKAMAMYRVMSAARLR